MTTRSGARRWARRTAPAWYLLTAAWAGVRAVHDVRHGWLDLAAMWAAGVAISSWAAVDAWRNRRDSRRVADLP